MSAIGSRGYWLREAKIAADDGHPRAALAAYAFALLPPGIVKYPERIMGEYTEEWRLIAAYAASLGVLEVLGDGPDNQGCPARLSGP